MKYVAHKLTKLIIEAVIYPKGTNVDHKCVQKAIFLTIISLIDNTILDETMF